MPRCPTRRLVLSMPLLAETIVRAPFLQTLPVIHLIFYFASHPPAWSTCGGPLCSIAIFSRLFLSVSLLLVIGASFSLLLRVFPSHMVIWCVLVRLFAMLIGSLYQWDLIRHVFDGCYYYFVFFFLLLYRGRISFWIRLRARTIPCRDTLVSVKVVRLSGRRVHVFAPPGRKWKQLFRLALRSFLRLQGISIIFILALPTALVWLLLILLLTVVAVASVICPRLSTRRRSLRLPRAQGRRDNEHQDATFESHFQAKCFCV
jgi:hypothetical protein